MVPTPSTMVPTPSKFIKVDNNKILNEASIRWVKKMDECLHICARSWGCSADGGDTHRLCKVNNPESYERLNRHFQ
jgi:hypothetical protein